MSGRTTTGYTDISATAAAMTYYYVFQTVTPDWSSLDSLQASGATPATCP